MKFAELLEGDKVVVIAEIGINHEGSFNAAQKLVTAAHESGADAIKFQYRDLSNIYLNKNEIGDEILFTEINRNFLTVEQILNLSKIAKDLGLLVGISFFHEQDIENFGSEIKIFDFFKIPSAEVSNNILINHLLNLDKYLLISTGTANENTITSAFTNINTNKWMPLHCISNYPTASYNAKLGYISHLKNKWNRPVGYSSHDANWAVICAAVMLGIKVVERHITLDKKSSGLDHTSSSTPDEFKLIIDFVRNRDKILLGEDERIPNQGELLNLQNLGRSFYATKNMEIGSLIERNDFKYLSPRVGYGYELFENSNNPILVKKIKSGEVLTSFHIKTRNKISAKVKDFANKSQIGLPVRLHDYSEISRIFGLSNYEFHFSYGEIEKLTECKNFIGDINFTIHLPDYCSANELMDPFSLKEEQRNKSLKIIDETLHFAEKIYRATGRTVGIVGSFSVVNSDIEKFYDNYANFLKIRSSDKFYMALQWLPPIAWYFGGSVELSVMNNKDDVNKLIQRGMNIVMDTSHLFLGKNFFKFNEIEILELLNQNIKWFHISGASGIDGEGRDFSKITDDEYGIFAALIKSDRTKIIEVWQGHLDKYAGFQQALESLEERFHDE